MSDDLFKTPAVMILEAGNTLIKTPQYLFIAASHTDEKRVSIYSSSYRSGFNHVKSVRLPTDALLSNTFTVLDTSSDQVFLFIENHGLQSPFGNLYISDEKGRSFTLSKSNVIKGQAVDFEKISSLDGTYVVNKFMKEHDQKKAGKEHQKEFDEADVIAAETRKSRMSRQSSSGTENAKQAAMQLEVNPIEESVPASEVQDNVKTYITHNKGGSWELLRAPTTTSKGKPIECFTEDGCSLHLEIYSHKGELAPVYSTASSVGIVLGTGNLGKRLTANDQAKNLYISRDGGLTWRSVKPGVYIYEIGDHGSIIVIAKKNTPTKEIEYSHDEGQTWEKLQISESEIFITNVIIEPNSISQ